MSVQGRQAILTSAARPTAADLLLTFDRGAQGVGASDADASPLRAPMPTNHDIVTRPNSEGSAPLM